MGARIKSSLNLLIPLSVGLFMLFLSWQRWADILIDYGRQLYIPWQLIKGSVLYKDIAFFYGPFSSYLHAFLFRVFGTHILVIAVFNILLTFALAFIIYRIFFKLTDKVTAIACATTFLAIFAFSQYYSDIANYNFVCPYSYELTHGLILSFLSILIFISYLKYRSATYIFIIGLLTGLVFLTKPEVFFSIVIAMLAGIACFALISSFKLKKVIVLLSLFLAGFIIPAFVFVFYLLKYMPLGSCLATVVFPYAAIFNHSVTGNIFFRRMMGTDQPSLNLLKLLLVSSCYVAVVFIFRFISLSVARARNAKIAALFNASIFLITCLTIGVFWSQIFRGLPLATAALAAYLGVSIWRFRADIAKINIILPLFVLTVFALLLLIKVVLNVRVLHYDFALAMPAALLLVAIFVYKVPVILNIKPVVIPVRFLSLAILGVVLATHMIVSWQNYRFKCYPVGLKSEVMLDFEKGISSRGAIVNMALKEIEKIIKKDDNFVVFPEGATLNYWTRRNNPTPYIGFSPIEFALFGEGDIFRSFVKNMPDYVIIVDKDISEFGFRRTVDMPAAAKILAWIRRNYYPVYEIGSRPLADQGFGIVIARRATGQLKK